MPPVDVRKLLAQLKAVKDQYIHDEKLRKQLYDAAREVAIAQEQPRETAERVFYAVRELSSYRLVVQIRSLIADY